MPAGRPPFKPTDEQRKTVEAMSGYGVPLEQIAALVGDGIDEETLRKHFKTEIIQGKAKANSKIGQTLFQKATKGDTAAAIWWSKTQMGWKEHKEITAENTLIIRDEISKNTHPDDPAVEISD